MALGMSKRNLQAEFDSQIAKLVSMKDSKVDISDFAAAIMATIEANNLKITSQIVATLKKNRLSL